MPLATTVLKNKFRQSAKAHNINTKDVFFEIGLLANLTRYTS